MRILCTGGAGFIGSHLCEALSAEHEVWSLDNYFTGSKKNHVPNVEYIKAHTKDIHKLTFKPDLIYHLGEYSRVEQSFADYKKVWEYNVVGTHAVLEFTKDVGAKIVYAGSSTKFGDNGPNSSPYASSKANNTQLVKNYGEWFGIDYAITYFYNVYGGREIADGQYATLIAKFIKAHKNGERLTITRPGVQKRNFTHIDDTISALKLVGFHGQGDEYGIGSDQAYSVIDVAEMLENDYIFVPEARGNRMAASVISDKTKALGWQQTRNLKDYIKSVIDQ